MLLQAVFASGNAYQGIKFIENKGQWESNILFRAELPVGALFIEKNCFTYIFNNKEAIHQLQHNQPVNNIKHHAVKVYLTGSKNPTKIIKDKAATEYYNYFTGKHQDKWISNVNAYSRIVMEEIYEGINLELIANENKIKLNFHLKPGADFNKIKLQYIGADKLLLDNNGNLDIYTNLGTITEEKPVSLQQINGSLHQINTEYILTNNTIQFKPDYFNPKEYLIIDPNIIFGTYIGSAADNFGFAAAYDSDGNAYGAGTVYAANFVATTGAYDISFNGGSSSGDFARDAFLAKFSADGKQLLWCTFLGGSHNEQPHSVTVNNKNEILLFGTTASTDFPVTQSAFQKTNKGQTDIFISKFNSSGNSLLGSTYFGGSNVDGINGAASNFYNPDAFPLSYNYADYYRGEIITDNINNNVYIATSTQSRPLENIVLLNAAQTSWGGGFQDGLLLKFNDSLSQLIFSTYMGGNNHDALYGLCFDNANNLIVCGGSNSSNLNAASPHQAKGGIDGIIIKYTNNGSLQKIIYNGTAGYDQNFLIQTDRTGSIYVLGQTNGNMAPTTGVYYQANGKQFIAKYDNNLNILSAQTIFGQGGLQPELAPSAFMVDECGRIYVCGWGGATNMSYNGILNNIFGMPITADAFQKNTDGSDFYLMVLRPNFTGLLYGTYYGGAISQEHVDGGTSHFDKRGIVYQSVCAGCGGFSDFPTTADAHSRTNPGKRPSNPNQGGCNLAIFKFDLRTYLNKPAVNDTFITIKAGEKLNYQFITTDTDNDMLDFYFFSPSFTKLGSSFSIKDTIKVSGESRVKFEWQTSCANLTGDTVIIDVEVNDNACPINNLVKAKIKILVVSEKEPSPYPDCLKAINDNETELRWNKIATPNFGGYLILRSAANSNFIAIDSINNQNKTSYNDIKAFNHLTQNYCYKIISYNNCKQFSDTSRTICSVVEFDTIGNPGFSNINDTLYILKPFEQLSSVYLFNADNNKDSVNINVTGLLINNGRLKVNQLSGMGYAAASFNFEALCSDVGADTFLIYFTVKSNQCPRARIKTKKVKIIVEPLPTAPPPVISCPRIIDENTVEIHWDSLNANIYTEKLLLFRSLGNLQKSIFETQDLSAKKYKDANAVNRLQNNYCYYISTTDRCQKFGDTSQKVCINDYKSHPQQVPFFNATVVNNNAVQINWFCAKADSFWRYLIYKSSDRSDNFNLIKEIFTNSDTSYTDELVNVKETSYCYKIVNYDICGAPALNAKPSCSMVLNGSLIPFENYLNWQPYDYWKVGTQRYIILKTEPGLYSDKVFNQVPPKTIVANDNNLNYDNGIYQYTVKAIENAGGNNAFSLSNTIELVQPPVVYAPNAFTPNNDNLNESYKTSNAFVKDFNLQIYNRWGELIFETKNKYQGFDAVFKNVEIQNDVYFYIIYYTGFDNSVYTKKGNITLLK